MQQQIIQNLAIGLPIKGIIQVGSNTGQELNQFKLYTKNIICFEPIPEVFNQLERQHPDVKCYNFALGDTNETKTMHIASNNGESSSFLKPLNHINEFRSIAFNSTQDLDIKRFDSLEIDINEFNVLVSDTQGYEVQVLKGFGNLLDGIDAIYVEYIDGEFYEGDSNLQSITEYLKEHNFILSAKLAESPTWGNALYTKINNK